MNIKKGQKVWVNTRHGIEETIVASVGRKYITLEDDTRIKYNKDNLRQVDAYGIARTIILDIEQYKTDCYYSSLKDRIRLFDWSLLDREDLEKVKDILNEYW